MLIVIKNYDEIDVVCPVTHSVILFDQLQLSPVKNALVHYKLEKVQVEKICVQETPEIPKILARKDRKRLLKDNNYPGDVDRHKILSEMKKLRMANTENV